jgi:hypothetical protein
MPFHAILFTKTRISLKFQILVVYPSLQSSKILLSAHMLATFLVVFQSYTSLIALLITNFSPCMHTHNIANSIIESSVCL